MKIKYLLTLSICAVATNHCNDNQQKSLCDQPASAVLAGSSGSARPATKYDVNWQEAFKKKATPLIQLFVQLKEAVQANDSKRASDILELMKLEDRTEIEYLSLLRDFNNGDYSSWAEKYKTTEDFFESKDEYKYWKNLIRQEIMRFLYEGTDKRTPEINDILEFINYNLFSLENQYVQYLKARDIPAQTRSLIDLIYTIYGYLNGIKEWDYVTRMTESKIKHIEDNVIPSVTKNPLMIQRAKKVLNEFKQRQFGQAKK